MSPLSDPFPVLYVADVGRSARFYRDLIGCEEIYRFPDDAEPGFVSLTLGGGKLSLTTAASPREFLGRERSAGLTFELAFAAEDTDAEVERLRAAGVRVLREPADMPWGDRMAYVEDPDGNPVQIFTSAAASS
jgi:lactoylglutathione lyase